MFPIALDLTLLPIILVGNGPKTARRLKLLEECGAAHISIFADQADEALTTHAGSRLTAHLPSREELAKARLVMIVDIEEEKAITLANLARELHILVNVEDNKPFCDFHFPSFVKRGDLLLSVSSGGKSPSLSLTIKRWLEEIFDSSWADKLEELGRKREEWQGLGLSYTEIKEQSERWIQERKWLNR